MEKFFYPDETYDKAIRSGDVGVLRALLTGIIGSDPTFATTEFDEAVNYIKNKSIELNGAELVLTEEYMEQEDEFKKEEKEWNEYYFLMNLVWLRDNFNLSKRFPLIKKIGKAVYKNKETFGKFKAKRSVPERTGRPKSKKDQAVRTAGGGDIEDVRLFSGILEWAKDHWWFMLIIAIVVILLVVLGVKLAGRN